MEQNINTDFLEAMMKMTSSVTVIASKEGDSQYAMTATSVVSLTLEPPSMLICINKKASIHSILSEESKLSINILSTSQKEFSELCSNKSKENERFKGDDWSYLDGIPYATNSVSNLFCECKQIIDYETHSIFMCKIISLINNDSRDGLLYHNASYNV